MGGKGSDLSDATLFLLPILFIGFLVVGLCFAFCCYLLRTGDNSSHCHVEFQRRFTPFNGLRKTNYKKKWLASSSLKSDTCAICLDDFRNKEDISICRCGHAYHCKCIMKWMEIKETCPICQRNCRQTKGTGNGERTPLLLDI
ncbi:RING finger protein 24-like [Montipora capricornis]|uniref:RING finger protein 24-like n=1 Tax=Montipora foliosa TaxID=591990 RepID=UPI0035F17C67